MQLIDKKTKKHPDARTPGELPVPEKGRGKNGKVRDKDRIYYDDAVKGFGIRVSSTGARSFILNYWIKGCERRYTIGRHPDYSVTAARDMASKLKRKIRDEGYDPLAEIQAAREAPTMADLAARYDEEHLPDKRPSSRRDDRAAIAQDILPGLGRTTKVAAVTSTHIKKLHRKISEHAPYKANRVLALLSKMFNLAIEWKMRSKQDGNPCEGVKRNPETKRKRYLKPDELARLMIALDAHPDVQATSIIRLLLLTGARFGEVVGARWDHFDLDAGTWVKPGATTKQRTEHEVPLSPDAVQLLSDLFDEADDGAEFVFPGRHGVGHRVDLKRPWPEICKAAGITGLRVHDLRHSYASFLVSAGHGLPVVGALLGHTQASTTQRYAHLHDEVTRRATGQVGAMVKRAGKRGAKVVKLHERRRPG
jgi:integrase